MNDIIPISLTLVIFARNEYVFYYNEFSCEAMNLYVRDFSSNAGNFPIKKKDLHFDIGQLAIGFTMTDRFDLTFSSNGLSSTRESFICVFI